MEFHPDIFKIEPHLLNAKTGSLLISEPFASDRYFSRSAVLLAEHNQDGTVGFVLNKLLSSSVNKILNLKTKHIIPLFLGGPVKTENLFIVHGLGKKMPGSVQIKDDLYWGGDIEILQMMIEHNAIDLTKLRFFAGYAGWEKNQLNTELKNNFWIVNNSYDSKQILKYDKDIWTKMTRKSGEKYRLWTNFPVNPEEN